jgi:hypothetical protein
MTWTGGWWIIRVFSTVIGWVLPRYNVYKELEGTWDYECVVEGGMTFPNSQGNAHGGECSIRIKNKFHTTAVSIRGKRTWEGNKVNGKLTSDNLAKALQWNSLKGAFIGHDEVMYTYSITDEPVHGMTLINLYDERNPKVSQPHGNFYYFPNESEVENKTPFETLNVLRRQKLFGGISGTVRFYNHRKKQ